MERNIPASGAGTVSGPYVDSGCYPGANGFHVPAPPDSLRDLYAAALSPETRDVIRRLHASVTALQAATEAYRVRVAELEAAVYGEE